MKTSIRIALRNAAATAALLGAGVSHADAPSFTMTVFEDAAHGSKVVAGRYDSAIERLTRAPVRFGNDVEGLTNLCVAYTKSGKLDKAVDACESAVTLLEASDRELPTKANARGYAQRQYATELAIALSNRGVLRVAQGQEELAAKDFEKAAELEAGVSAPAINLARLER